MLYFTSQKIRGKYFHSVIFLLGMLLLGANQSQAADLSGNWSGTWEDCLSGHSGPLRGTFCRCDDNHYRVTFSGRFFKVVPFQYSVVLTVVGQDGDKVLLAGESNLGPLFGTFTYQAEAIANHFVANFSSCRYQGRFILNRCCP
jgi:hypothetical protein